MATIDLPAIQTYYEEQLRLVQLAVGGAANHKRFIGITEEEHAQIVVLGETCVKLEEAMTRFLTACKDMIALGWPLMPTLSVPASMIVSLDREAAENEAFHVLFVTTEPVASALGKPIFGDPEPQ
jgi:hypothetical protein